MSPFGGKSLPACGFECEHSFLVGNSEASEPSCAWSEGFASFWALFSNESYDGDLSTRNDGPVFDFFFAGGRINYESRTGFASGDRVEGNVTAALWDIYDSSNDDAPGSGIGSIFRWPRASLARHVREQPA